MIRKKAGVNKHLVTIGLLGCCTGVGVTHLAVMLAGFLSSKEHRKTALIEFNHAGALKALRKLYSDEKTDFNNCFEINGVDYYTVSNDREFAAIFQMGYEYLVIDFGHEWTDNISRFMQCDIGCVVGSLNEWKISQFEECVTELEGLNISGNFHYVSTFGVQRFGRDIEKNFRIKIRLVPFEPSPFLLHKETFTLLEILSHSLM